MTTDWNFLSDELQLVLSQEALRRAGEIIAGQAEMLAGEIDHGFLIHPGGGGGPSVVGRRGAGDRDGGTRPNRNRLTGPLQSIAERNAAPAASGHSGRAAANT